jgi:hypothetical protein
VERWIYFCVLSVDVGALGLFIVVSTPDDGGAMLESALGLGTLVLVVS